MNAWSPVDGTVREGLEGVTLGEVRQWGMGSGLVNAHTIPSVSVSALFLWIKCILSGTSAMLAYLPITILLMMMHPLMQ